MKTIMLLTAGFALLVGSSAQAQSLQAVVESTLKEVVAGNCPDTMGAALKYACKQGMPQMQQRFQAIGALVSVEYQGTDQTPGGPAEVYVAKHETGEVMWFAQGAPDGRLMTLWSPG